MKLKITLGAFFVLMLIAGCTSPNLSQKASINSINLSSPHELPDSLKNAYVLWNGKIIELAQPDKQSSTPYIYGAAAFSHDYQYLAYNTCDIQKGFDQIGKEYIVLLNLRTGKSKIVVKQEDSFPQAVYVAALNFSPDDSTLYIAVGFSEDTHFLKVDLDSGETEWISVGPHIWGFLAPDITKEGQILDLCSVIVGNTVYGENCLFDPQGHLLRYFGTDVDWDSKFLPDEQSIVYSDGNSIYIESLNGREKRRILPKGHIIAVAEDALLVGLEMPQKPECERLYVANLDGSNLRLLNYIPKQCASE